MLWSDKTASGCCQFGLYPEVRVKEYEDDTQIHILSGKAAEATKAAREAYEHDNMNGQRLKLSFN